MDRLVDHLEQIEEILKKGYRKAVLGFVKSRAAGTTSYFLEITKGTLKPSVERIFISKIDYILATDLLDKYDELHRIEKGKEKEKKQKAKEEREKKRDLEIQKLIEKEALELAIKVKEKENEEEEDLRSERVSDLEIIEDDETEDTQSDRQG